MSSYLIKRNVGAKKSQSNGKLEIDDTKLIKFALEQKCELPANFKKTLSKKYEQQSLNKEKSDDEEENFAHKSQNMICLPYESLQHFQQFHQYQQQQQQQPIGLGLPQLLPQLPQLPQQQPQLQQLIPQRPTINEQQRPATNEQLPTTTLQQPLQEHQSLEKTEDQSINVEEFKSLLACMKELKQQQTLCGLNGRFGLNIE